MGQYRGLENKKILVVEDVELNQFLARHIMESWGCIVEIAENGALAVEKLNATDFDLVLMDIQMPVMDGMEATRKIRQMPNSEKSSIPVVALTANAMRGEYDVFLNAGMDDCLPKPFEESALFETVYKHIARSKGQQVGSGNAPAPAAAAPQPVKPAGPLYDLSMVEAISAGDKTFIVKMLKLFLDTVPATLKELKAACAGGDWKTLSKVAHKLKSTIDSMEIAAAKMDIRQIESMGKTGERVDELPALVDKVIALMETVMTQVRKDHAI